MNSDPYPAEMLFNIGYNGGNTTLLILYIVLAIVISSICSLLEATLLSTPMNYINTLEQQGVKGAARLKSLKTDIDKSISSILVVNTIANTVGAAGVGRVHAQARSGYPWPGDGARKLQQFRGPGKRLRTVQPVLSRCGADLYQAGQLQSNDCHGNHE